MLYLKDFYQQYCIPKIGDYLYIPGDGFGTGGKAKVREIQIKNNYKDSNIFFYIEACVDSKEVKLKIPYSLSQLLESQKHLETQYGSCMAREMLI